MRTKLSFAGVVVDSEVTEGRVTVHLSGKNWPISRSGEEDKAGSLKTTPGFLSAGIKGLK